MCDSCSTRRRFLQASAAALASAAASASPAQESPRVKAGGPKLRGKIVDAATGRPIAARVRLHSNAGVGSVHSGEPGGSAIKHGDHTTLSAHAFDVDVPAGPCTLFIERGKDYVPLEKTVEVGPETMEITLPLRRWCDPASRGWYSGDTHVHREMDDLPNLLAAEDLNVALPLAYWGGTMHKAPGRWRRWRGELPQPRLVTVDPTHVIWPVNSEYEIYGGTHDTLSKQSLGTVIVLGHRHPLAEGVPPARPLAEQARRQGALLDLEKHCWPWSLMIAPVMKVDLFELLNNHLWHDRVLPTKFPLEFAAKYMNLETTADGVTERGWVDFGLQCYYALLNCGLRMKPSAGTASGVMSTPLGYNRVYVQLTGDFSYEKWMAGLAAGRTFATNGPMLFVEVGGQPPGGTIRGEAGKPLRCRVTGSAESVRPLRTIEVLVGGRVVREITPANRLTKIGGYLSPIETEIEVTGTSWIAVRTFEDRTDGHVRFAHSSPVHVEVPGQPPRARREELDYLVGRLHEEIERKSNLLTPEELQEYRDALRFYATR